MQIAELFYSIKGEGVSELESKLNKTSKKLAGFGTAFTAGVTTPILAMGAGIAKTTMNFDKEMSKVEAITGATGKEFDTLRGLAIDMGSSTSKSATEAAEAINYMGLAGWDLTQIQDGIEPVLRASEAGMMDLGTTSDLVTDSMSALGIGTEDLGRYLDIAAKAQNTSNQSMEQFLNAMVTAGGTFKMFNISLEESGSLLGILANRGFKGSEAGNALTSIFANLTGGAGQAGKAMKELGLEVYDGEGKFRGATTILKEMNEKFDGMTEAQRNSYIQMIGGKTRTKELNALLSGTAEELDDLSKGLYDSEGALSTMAKTMQDNFAGQITSIQSKLEGIAISIGDRLTPYLRIAGEWIAKLADAFYNLPTSTKDIIIIIGLIAAAIGPLLLIFAGLVSSVGAVSAAFTAVSGAIAAISTPVIVTTAIIIGIVTAIGLLLAKSKNARKVVVDFAGKIKESFGPIKKLFLETFSKFDIKPIIKSFKQLKATLNPVVVALKGLGKVVGGILAIAIGVVIGLFNGIVKAIDNVVAAVLNIVGIVTSVFGIIVGIITNDSQMIKDSFKNLWENVKGFFVNAFTAIIDLVSGFVDGIVTWFTSLYDTLVGHSIIPDLINSIIDWFSTLPGKVIAFVKDLVSKAIAKFTDMKNKVVAKIKELVSKAVSIFKTIVSKISDIVSNLKSTLQNKFNSIKTTISDIVNNIKSTLQNKFNAAKNNVVNIFNTLKNKIGSKFRAIKGFIQPVINKFNKIKGAIQGVINKVKNLKFPSVPDWVPGFASGVKNFSGGWAMVGEQGAELVHLPPGTDVYSNSQSKNMLNNDVPYFSRNINNVNNNQKKAVNIIIEGNTFSNRREFDDVMDQVVRHLKRVGVQYS